MNALRNLPAIICVGIMMAGVPMRGDVSLDSLLQEMTRWKVGGAQ